MRSDDRTGPGALRRSTLATPASSEKMMARAAASAADAVFLDLEDAVAPHAKDDARLAAGRALRDLHWGDKTRGVRVNAVGTRWCHRDVVSVVEVAGASLDLVIVPKVTARRDVWFVDTLLTQLELELGLPAGGIALEVLVEEAAALADVEAIARCSTRTTSLVLGTADLAASLAAGPAADWTYARTRLVTAARAAGKEPMDGPWGAVDDPDGCRRDALAGRALGMAGKWVIHPDQIPIVNDAFTPTGAEIAEAHDVVRALDAAEADGRGAAIHKGRMVDGANGRSHRALLRRVNEIRRRDDG